jgi:hypothetical protein
LAEPQDQRQSKTNGDFLKTQFTYVFIDSLIRASAKLLNIHIALPALELNLMLLDSNCNNHCTRVGTVRCCKQQSNISYLNHQIFGFIIKMIIRKVSGRVFDCCWIKYWQLNGQTLYWKWNELHGRSFSRLQYISWLRLTSFFAFFFSKIKIMFCAFIIAPPYCCTHAS